ATGLSTIASRSPPRQAKASSDTSAARSAHPHAPIAACSSRSSSNATCPLHPPNTMAMPRRCQGVPSVRLQQPRPVTTMLKIENLHAGINDREILKGLSLDLQPGQVHAIMGPNGAGKSTLGNILAGREGYDVTEGTVEFEGQPLLDLDPEERAAAGLFLAFQYPVEIPGVNNTYFLRSALNAQRKARGEDELDSMQFL